MRHLPVEPPPFFHRGPSPLTRLAVFALLSLALLFADTRYRYLENIRRGAAIVLYPMQRIVQMPGEALAYVGTYFSSQRTLADDNAALQAQLLSQAPLVQGYPAVEKENARLRGLMKLEARVPVDATAAEVLYSSRDPFTQKLFVDKGEAAGVQAGRAVIDSVGVVGQVTRVYPYMSEVTLVTDKDHAVPVKVERSGVRTVMYGAGAARPPELRYLSPSVEIEPGDLLVTSGIDGTYPAGLAVAQVVSVERETGQSFAHVTCKALAGIDNSAQVLILGSTASAPPRPEEPADTAAPRKGRGRRKG
ncbi:MAG TPA: rod shape-determining protein MreC [Casimicrobiaceae bacterium]|jgi:rod shape-determining protein MreC|nr:rod shape-determining protein MreC [Casimicrobiaceae bacterium]